MLALRSGGDTAKIVSNNLSAQNDLADVLATVIALQELQELSLNGATKAKVFLRHVPRVCLSWLRMWGQVDPGQLQERTLSGRWLDPALPHASDDRCEVNQQSEAFCSRRSGPAAS